MIVAAAVTATAAVASAMAPAVMATAMTPTVAPAVSPAVMATAVTPTVASAMAILGRRGLSRGHGVVVDEQADVGEMNLGPRRVEDVGRDAVGRVILKARGGAARGRQLRGVHSRQHLGLQPRQRVRIMWTAAGRALLASCALTSERPKPQAPCRSSERVCNTSSHASCCHMSLKRPETKISNAISADVHYQSLAGCI